MEIREYARLFVEPTSGAFCYKVHPDGSLCTLSTAGLVISQQNHQLPVASMSTILDTTTPTTSLHDTCRLTDPIDATFKTIARAFPKALPNNVLVDRVTKTLTEHGIGGETTLLTTALCCDELNRGLERDFATHYGCHFSMGGLAGFAFGGVTSFGSMAAHIPEGGSCLIIYGPHVGVDSAGVVGKIGRRGRKDSSSCCGSAAAAAAYVASVRAGAVEACMPTDCIDIQQYFVGKMLLQHGERLATSRDADVELPYALFDEQVKLMHSIVAEGCVEVGINEKIILLGGIQINTPEGCPEFFLPLSFEIRDHLGRMCKDLLMDS